MLLVLLYVFLEEINLTEAHRGEMGRVVVDDCFPELLVSCKTVLVLPGELHKFVRKYLHELCT